ncbi:hypothetical protein GALMADRAFT_283382 [Galerina marginata CBS 339.88]|uniref:Uncharacterized protein n=1 Tax=Galerina marginata (strain CBS 339.88) TaxID=685588 RepID=A0A067SAK4_GALM3|nr:hypothetical protein GALMADRAFT_283382 [Galerina marginata CBS 339.88]
MSSPSQHDNMEVDDEVATLCREAELEEERAQMAAEQRQRRRKAEEEEKARVEAEAHRKEEEEIVRVAEEERCLVEERRAASECAATERMSQARVGSVAPAEGSQDVDMEPPEDGEDEQDMEETPRARKEKTRGATVDPEVKIVSRPEVPKKQKCGSKKSEIAPNRAPCYQCVNEKITCTTEHTGSAIIHACDQCFGRKLKCIRPGDEKKTPRKSKKIKGEEHKAPSIVGSVGEKIAKGKGLAGPRIQKPRSQTPEETDEEHLTTDLLIDSNSEVVLAMETLQASVGDATIGMNMGFDDVWRELDGIQEDLAVHCQIHRGNMLLATEQNRLLRALLRQAGGDDSGIARPPMEWLGFMGEEHDRPPEPPRNTACTRQAKQEEIEASSGKRPLVQGRSR